MKTPQIKWEKQIKKVLHSAHDSYNQLENKMTNLQQELERIHDNINNSNNKISDIISMIDNLTKSVNDLNIAASNNTSIVDDKINQATIEIESKVENNIEKHMHEIMKEVTNNAQIIRDLDYKFKVMYEKFTNVIEKINDISRKIDNLHSAIEVNNRTLINLLNKNSDDIQINKTHIEDLETKIKYSNIVMILMIAFIIVLYIVNMMHL